MNVVKFKVLRLPVLSDQIDNDIGVLDRLTNGLLVIQVVGMKEHLAQVTGHLETQYIVVVATVGQNHLRALLAELIADISTQEA